MSNLMKADKAVSGILHNYPRWPSTFGACATEGCQGIGRGCGKCALCYEKELAELVGEDLAEAFHESVKKTTILWHDIDERLGE